MKFLMYRKTGIILYVSMIILICFLVGNVYLESYAEDIMFLKEKIQSPHDLARWLESDFKYVFRLNDEWQTPSETINKRAGDCEDFATLDSDVLEKMGVKSHIVIIKFRGMDFKHAISIWKEKNGTYSYISNQKLVRTGIGTIEKALSVYYPDWETLTFTDSKGKVIKLVSRR